MIKISLMMTQLSNINDSILVSISDSPWDHPYWTSRQFLMYELSEHLPVLYATDRTYVREFLKADYWRQVFLQKRRPPFDPPSRLHICRLAHLIPKFYGYSSLDGYFAKMYGRLLRKKSARAGRKRLVAYLWEPNLIDCLAGLNPDVVIYHIYDKLDAMPATPAQKAVVLNAEKQILRLAHAVITPHTKIANELDHSNVHVVHNGVFQSLFKNCKTSPDLNSIPNPRIGYVGVINSKVDFDLLLYIANYKPDWSLVFGGPVKPGPWQNNKSFGAIKKLSNVTFLPPVPFDKICALVRGLDIGIMPYNLSTWMSYSESPLKMYQYWALGIPIVSVPLPNLSHCPGIVSVAATPEAWVKAIDYEIVHNKKELVEKRKRLALENTWKQRAERVLKIIDSL